MAGERRRVADLFTRDGYGLDRRRNELDAVARCPTCPHVRLTPMFNDGHFRYWARGKSTANLEWWCPVCSGVWAWDQGRQQFSDITGEAFDDYLSTRHCGLCGGFLRADPASRYVAVCRSCENVTDVDPGDVRNELFDGH